MSEQPMLFPAIDADFSEVRGRLTANFPLRDITWFRVGGPAQLLFQPADESDLQDFLKVLPADVPVLPIGLGSNLLVRDGGIEGVVIKLSARGFGGIDAKDNKLTIGAAAPDKRVAQAALQAGLSGFAFYHGIPGSVGGALRMNAGAHGTETKNRLSELVAIDRSGRRHVMTVDDLGYSYRHSTAADDLIFTSATMIGEPADSALIEAEMDAVQMHREQAQPIREKTGGSTFKNPLPDSAWKLIDAAGCRGLTVGGAQMSAMHCNFMINTGTASGFDLESLGETVRRQVFDHSGIRLQWEIKRLGRMAPGQHLITLEQAEAGGE